MGVIFTFYSKISLNDINEKTTLKIIKDNHDDCILQDGIPVYIDNSDELILSNGIDRIKLLLSDEDDKIIEGFMGFKYSILSELVNKLDAKFLSEYDEEELLRKNICASDEYIDFCMKNNGFT